MPVGGVGQGDGAQTVELGEFDGAVHGGVSGEVAGASVAGPAFDGSEAGDELGGCVRIDGAEADHFGEAWDAGDAVGADAVAVGFCGEAGGEGGTLGGETEVEHGAFEGALEFGERNAAHGFIRAHGVAGWGVDCRFKRRR